MRQEDGDSVNAAELCLSAHTGTHADGAFHVDEGGARIGAAPLAAYIGPARVEEIGAAGEIGADVLGALLGGEMPERLLLRTGCWTDPEVFPTHFPTLTPAAAQTLADAGVRLFGTDAPSVDVFSSRDLPVHHVFAAAGIAILENLLLDGVPVGPYELIALPLRLEDADASPVRAVLRPL